MPELLKDLVISYNPTSSLYNEEIFQPDFDGDIVDFICYFTGDIKTMKWSVPVDWCMWYMTKWYYNIEKHALVYGMGDEFTIWKCPAYEKLMSTVE